MTSENMPFDGGSGWEGFGPAEIADFHEWESELLDHEPIRRLSGDMARLTLADTVSYAESELMPEYEPKDEPIERYVKPKQEKYQPEQPVSRENGPIDGSFFLDREMFDAAMGLIYLTTGIPADELYD